MCHTERAFKLTCSHAVYSHLTVYGRVLGGAPALPLSFPSPFGVAGGALLGAVGLLLSFPSPSGAAGGALPGAVGGVTSGGAVGRGAASGGITGPPAATDDGAVSPALPYFKRERGHADTNVSCTS